MSRDVRERECDRVLRKACKIRTDSLAFKRRNETICCHVDKGMMGRETVDMRGS